MGILMKKLVPLFSFINTLWEISIRQK